MFKLTDISKSYGSAKVLHEVSLSCRRGEAVCLAGANAAGKTTLLTVAAGLQKPDAGQVQCDGRIGFVPQDNTLLSDLSVRDNLRLWYAACGVSGKPFAENSAETALGLNGFMKKRVSRLSGGMKKRVAIACAFAGNPEFLLLDEPFTALDLPGKTNLAELLCQLKERGTGLLFSSHDPLTVAAVANRLLLLSDGKIGQELELDSDITIRTEQVIHALSHM